MVGKSQFKNQHCTILNDISLKCSLLFIYELFVIKEREEDMSLYNLQE